MYKIVLLSHGAQNKKWSGEQAVVKFTGKRKGNFHRGSKNYKCIREEINVFYMEI
jgi:hypothetical protein